MKHRYAISRMVDRARRGIDRYETWYHVTYSGRLPSIAERGLRKGASRSIGAAGYDSHAAKGVFLTHADGVFFWHNRAEDFAEHNSDNFVEDELIPVVLRIKLPVNAKREVDELGSRDALADAIIVKNPILPKNIKVYTGKKWVPVSEYDDVRLDLAYREEVKEPDDEIEDENSWYEDPDEGEVLYYFVDQSLLIPPECRK